MRQVNFVSKKDIAIVYSQILLVKKKWSGLRFY